MYVVLIPLLLVVFIALLIWGKIERQWISLAIAFILILLGAVSIDEIFTYVDWDVLGLILGVSILTVYLEKSGFAEVIARHMVRLSKGSTYLLIFLISLVAGLISILMENVSVVVLLFPIVYNICRSLGTDPIIPTIMLALSANIAGSATMIGDPPAILTAGAFKLTFTDFIIYRGKPSMFFFTLISMILAITVTSIISSRKINIKPSIPNNKNGISLSIDKPFLVEAIVFLTIKIILLSLRHALHIPFSLTAAVAVGGITIARIIHRDTNSVVYAFKHGFEWKLLLFLIGVFVLSSAFEKHGIAYIFAEELVWIFKDNLMALVSSLLYLMVILSSVIDNVPLTMTMIPVVKKISELLLLNPVVIMWSVLIGITLGGNLTYMGASANVTAIRLLEKQGHNVSFTDFIKISIVYNTVSVVSAWILYIIFYIIL
ncbi:MAG: SLC13 family permease [Ignisphaera sp.]|uniref:Citrate transporter n=1 Tax=Ignisphaera aggregans TaxID=334771 RepID=A0A7C4NMH5_9CREN